MQNSPSQVKNCTTASWRITRGMVRIPCTISETVERPECGLGSTEVSGGISGVVTTV